MSDADRLAILEDPAHPQHEALIDELDARGSDDEPMGPDADAPFGYMKDEKTGERRAKKRPGRRPAPAASARAEAEQDPEDAAPAPTLSAEAPEDRTPIERAPDRAPDTGRRRGRGRAKAAGVPAIAAAKEPKAAPPPFRAGPIAKGMNKLYRKIGRLLKHANPRLGMAFIDMSEKEDEDDITVGEAWEELAKVNPAIRGFLLKLVTGGAYGGLFFAHLPLLIVVLTMEPIARRFPLGQVLLALREDGDDGQDGEQLAGGFDLGQLGAMAAGGGLGSMFADLMQGMTPADLANAAAFAQSTADMAGTRSAGGVRRGGDEG